MGLPSPVGTAVPPQQRQAWVWEVPTETPFQDGKLETFTAAPHECTKEVVSGSEAISSVYFLAKDYVSGPV